MSEPATALIGESFSGEGPEAAHINVGLGHCAADVVADDVIPAAGAGSFLPAEADVLAARATPGNPYYQAR
jgi:hypothetical protein